MGHIKILFTLLGLVTFLISCQEAGSNDAIVTISEGTNMAASVSPDQNHIVLALQGTLWLLPSDGGVAEPITGHLDDAHEPSWSPDGSRIAYHAYRDGNFHIWTVGQDGGEPEQLTQGYFDDREPNWSPDGRHIVFSSDRSGAYELWQLELSSGALEQLTFNEQRNFQPAWSPDGSRIAFVSERQEGAGIYLLEAGEEQLVAPSVLRLAAPSWNPSGTKLLFTAFSSSSNGYCGIYCRYSYQNLLHLDSGHVERISSNEDLFPFRASWTDDSAYLYTADGEIRKRQIRDRVVGEDNVVAISFRASIALNRPSYERRVHDFDGATDRASLGIFGPVVSPDGGQVAFAALGNLYIQYIGGPLKKLTNDKFVHLDPDWSPDGRRLAYISDRGGRMQIWIRNISSGEDRLLTPTYDGEAAMPSWSPDGRKIAFFTADYRKKWGSGSLMVADVATGEFEQVYRSVFVPGKASWSPDGSTIALMALHRFSSRFREGHNRFLLVSLENNEGRFVTPDESSALSMRNQNGPVWSPDGSLIAYVKDGKLWTVPVSGDGSITGEPKRLTDELADNISWTGDSGYLVYLSVDRLKRLELETGRSEEIGVDLNWRWATSDEDYVIQAGRVFTGLENRYLENMDILISGDRIERIVPRRDDWSVPRMDATDKVVIPGMFEMHSHQSSANGEMLGKLWLAYGITSVRDPGSDPYDSLYRKESWGSNALPGPRLFFTGGLMDGRPSYGLTHTVLDTDHLELEMDRANRLGFDFIKTYVRMPDQHQKRITERAHEIGIPVTSHEVFPAAMYGVESIEHDRATSRRGYAYTQSDLSNTYDDVIQLLTAAGMSMTPTLAVTGAGFAYMANRHDELVNDARLWALHSEEYMQSALNQRFDTDAIYRLSKKQDGLRRFVSQGGVISAGTDSPLPFPYAASLHAELWVYVDAGLTPFEALRSATIDAAKVIGVSDKLGSVETGKLADLVIVDGDPLYRIQDAMRVSMVIKNGILFELEDLLDRDM